MIRFSELASSLFQAMDSDFRKPAYRVEEFAKGFDQLVHRLTKVYRVDIDVYSQDQQIGRFERGESLNRAETFLLGIQSNPDVLEEVVKNATVAERGGSVIHLGDFDISPNKIEKLNANSDGYQRSDIIAILSHGAAKLELLLAGGDKGIPEVYATAIGQTRNELSLIKDAAKLAYDWNPEWGRLNVQNVLQKAKGRITKSMIRKGMAVGSLALASCMVPVDQNGRPTQFPEIVTENVPTEVVAVGVTPVVEMTASVPVKESSGSEHVNVSNFGAYERPDVSDELARLIAARDVTTDPVLLIELDNKIAEYEAGVEAVSALKERVGNLPGAADVKDDDKQIFNLAFEEEVGGVRRVTSAYEMATVKIDGKDMLAVLSKVDGDKIVEVDAWAHNDLTKDGEREVFYIDKMTGEKVTIMKTIKEKPGFMEVYLMDGTTLTVEMSLDATQTGGKMASFINMDMFLDLEYGKDGLELRIGEQRYRLDTKSGKWELVPAGMESTFTPAQQADVDKISGLLGGAYKIETYKEGDKVYANFIDAKTGEAIPEIRIDTSDPEQLSWSKVYEYRGHTIVIPQSMDKITMGSDGQAHFDFPGYEWKDGKFEPLIVEGQSVKNPAEAQVDLILDGDPTHTLLGLNELGNGDGYLKTGGFAKGEIKFPMYGMHWHGEGNLRMLNGDGTVSDITTTDFRVYNAKDTRYPYQVLFFMGKDKKVHSILIDSLDIGWKNTDAWGHWGNYPD